ncbi:hypothetical protein H4R18_003120 [Coemansia javaensis]|uniref:Uncharacterized protein n=1 Tax=Coemansia javaensis TaxID=2761396 RepID=A0A9W8H7W8_9FUNG|nr:hypothetical protein H4R18_003120 [Coemansia javaensis]
MLKRFWQAVGRRVWLRDYKDSMIPRTTFRTPAPASQPPYQSPVTAASAIANNPYYKRDVRRNYPRTEVYTQADVGSLLLLAHGPKDTPQQLEGGTAPDAAAKDVATRDAAAKDVVEALEKLGQPLYSAACMPPVPGAPYRYKLSPEQHVEGPGEYYPSYRVY